MRAIPAEIELDMNTQRETTVVVKGIWGWAAKRLGIQPWGQILILLLLGQAWIIWGIRTDLSEVKGSIQAMPLRISMDLLSQAKEDVSAKKITRAVQATDSAEILLARATAKRIPARPDDFGDLVAILNILNASSASPALVESVNDTRIVLANYKSALEPQPQMQGQQATVEKSINLTVEAATIDKSALPGSILVGPPGATFDFFQTPFIRRLANGPSIINVGFMNAAQTLDGFHWDGVAFVNTLIRYEGGEVELRSVRFINCTFQMSGSPRSAKVATYIALGQPYLKIGPSD